MVPSISFPHLLQPQNSVGRRSGAGVGAGSNMATAAAMFLSVGEKRKFGNVAEAKGLRGAADAHAPRHPGAQTDASLCKAEFQTHGL